MSSVFTTPNAPVACFTSHDTPLKFLIAYPKDEIQKHHARGELYEPEELEIISRHFPKGGVFCDIGANVGNHAVYVGKVLAPSKVIVFEPNPAAISVLVSNIMLNDLEGVTDTSHLGLGLSDENGEGFEISWRRPRWQMKNLGGAQLVQGEGEITVARGDVLLSDESVDFIKIDTEGMEIRVLAGLLGTIKKSRPTFFIEVDQINAKAMQEWLKENDYKVIERFSRYESNENLLCVPNE